MPERLNRAFDMSDAWAREPAELAVLLVSADGQPHRITHAEIGDRGTSPTRAQGSASR